MIPPRTLRPRLPSKIKKSDNKELDDYNKKLNNLLNDIENKKSKDLINKKINDIVNNVKLFKIDDSIGKDDSVDKNIDLLCKNARDLADKLSQEDEIDYDE